MGPTIASLKPPRFECDVPLVQRQIEPFPNCSLGAWVGEDEDVVSALTSRKPKVYWKAFNNFCQQAAGGPLKATPSEPSCRATASRTSRWPTGWI